MTMRGRVAVALVLELASLSVILGMDKFHSIDFDLFRLASKAWWHGASIYDLPVTHTPIGPGKLSFMNPPVAAVVLAPVTLLPRALGIVLWYAVSLAALAYTVHVFARIIATRFHGLDARHVTLAVLPALTLLGPVREELTFGQMDMVLMAAVVADCLTSRGHRTRGLLVGLAMAIKLLPGVFLLFFLLRKDVRALLLSGLGFLVGTAVGFAAAFDSSKDYWTNQIFEGDRVIKLFGWWLSPNQSLMGLTARFHWISLSGPVVLVLLYAVVLALTVVAMRKMFRIPGYGTAAALLVNAVVALLWAPTSWPYHWIWMVPALMVMTAVVLERRDLVFGGITALVAAVFYINSPWLMEFYNGSEQHWSVVQYLADDAYPLIALAALVILAIVRIQVPFSRSAVQDVAEGPETIRA
jgi:alpha-1,2-mannosyltransferase